MKPENIDELEEVISSAEFSQSNPNLFLYTTSKGILHICDLREKSSFQNNSSVNFEVGINQKKAIFSDLINSLSSGKFLKFTDYGVITRDYIGIKIWDIRGTSKPP